MKKYQDYVKEFQENNEYGLFFIENQLKKYLQDNKENQTEIEHILDYLYSSKKKFKSIGYKTILGKTKKWDKKLRQVAIKDIEKEGEDYKVVKDWEDGFKMVKLISKNSFAREGKNMSHCCASYYGKDTEVYSLRDKKNLPHATLEKDNQIKGKGNGSINPKYIKYVVEFLEEIGMNVRDSEMENLGYVNIEKIKDDNAIFHDLFRKKYFYKENEILDKNGNKYENITLWNKFKLFNLDTNLKIKWNFDIELSVKTFIKSSKKIFSGDNSKNASSGYYSQNASSGDNSQNASSGNNSKNASSGNNSKNASSGYYSKNASSGNNSQNASSGYNSQNASSGNNSQNASSGYYSQNASSGDNSQNASSGDYSQNASSGYNSQNAMYGNNSVSVNAGVGGKVKGKIGCWFCLTEWSNKQEIVCVKATKIDGKKIKEDTWYTLKNKEFIEIS